MKVLIVEDSDLHFQIIRRFVRLALMAEHLTVFDQAKSEAEAVKMIRENDYDLITEDGHLKNGGLGRNVINQVGDNFYGKMVGVSSDEEFLSFCREIGIGTFNKKDFSSDDAKARIKELVDKIIKPAVKA